ncbi:hypothetical protein [Pikeienuella sp. HZG-20]|uniref:hypothetical protein n=1 Tax=Paludibacillus litoralis TaxID=3133267 RepID=UPI0030EDB5BE
MLALISFVGGLIFGWSRARRRGGGIADRAQYAIGHGILFGLIGLAVAILIVRLRLFGSA